MSGIESPASIEGPNDPVLFDKVVKNIAALMDTYGKSFFVLYDEDPKPDGNVINNYPTDPTELGSCTWTQYDIDRGDVMHDTFTLLPFGRQASLSTFGPQGGDFQLYVMGVG